MASSRGTFSSPAARAARRWLTVIGSALALTAVLFFIWFARPSITRASQHPGGDTSNAVILNIDTARPAVVRIVTQYTFQASFQLCSGVPADTFNDSLAFSGSGAFISAHGDILTADHVVNAPADLIAQAAIEVETPQLYTDLKAKCAKALNTDLLTLQQTFDYFNEHPNLVNVVAGPPTSQVWLDTGYVGAYSQQTVRAAPNYALKVRAESSFDQNDVAIAQIALDDTPSIALGNSSDLSPTDTLSVIGFPGNGDVSSDPTDFLTESVNQILVSALKQNTAGGGPVIQVGGNIEHGDSGGPAIDSQGQIVGIVSFGLSDQGSTRFLQASSSVQPLITQLGLDMKPGAFQTAWHQALLDYASNHAGHWHAAAAEFQSIATSYPRFAGVRPYLTYAQTQANQEVIARPQAANKGFQFSTRTILYLASGAALVVALLIVVIGLAQRGRRQRRTQAEAAKYALALSQAPPVPLLEVPQQPGSLPLPLLPPVALCANGHPLAPYAAYCSICGAARV